MSASPDDLAGAYTVGKVVGVFYAVGGWAVVRALCIVVDEVAEWLKARARRKDV